MTATFDVHRCKEIEKIITCARSFCQFLISFFPIFPFSRRMIESGYLAACQNFYHKLVANVSIYENHLLVAKERLEMEHFVVAFLILAIGLTLSAFVFIFEILTRANKELKGNCNKFLGNRWFTQNAMHSVFKREFLFSILFSFYSLFFYDICRSDCVDAAVATLSDDDKFISVPFGSLGRLE